MSPDFDNNTLDLVKHMSDFEKFEEQLPSREKLYSLLTGKKISDKEYEHVLNVSNKFEIENDERLSQFVFKM